MRILTTREKMVFFITAGVVLMSAGYRFFLWSFITRNTELDRQIASTTATFKKYLIFVSMKEQIETKFRDKFVSMTTPQGGTDSQITGLSELESLAKAAQIQIVDIRPHSSSESHALYRESFTEVRMEGPAEGFWEFIYNIEHSPSLLRIKKFQLTAKSNTALLEGTLTISQISLKQ